MTIELPAETERLIQGLIDSGRFTSPQDVVGNAVARVMEDDVLGSYEPKELHGLIQEGIDAADRGETVSLEKARLHILGTLREVEAR